MSQNAHTVLKRYQLPGTPMFMGTPLDQLSKRELIKVVAIMLEARQQNIAPTEKSDGEKS